MNSFTKVFDGSTPSSGGAYWGGLPDHSRALGEAFVNSMGDSPPPSPPPAARWLRGKNPAPKRAQTLDPVGDVAWIAARSNFDTRSTAVVWREAERRLEDRASRIDLGRRLAERIYNQPLQSRIANTTIVVIEFH